MKFLIPVHITIESEDGDTAVQDIQDFMSAALIGEPCPIEDYSIEEVLESWNTYPEKEPEQLSFNFKEKKSE